MSDIKKEITIPLWKHNSGHLTGNLGPFEVTVYRVATGAEVAIGGAIYLLETKTSPKGLVYYKSGAKGFDFTLFKNESANPKAPTYRLLISEWKPKEVAPKVTPQLFDVPPASWGEAQSANVQPVKPFQATSFEETDVPF